MSSTAPVEPLSLQDPSQMREFFQARLIPDDGRRREIATCELDYVRQSQTRVSLQFTLGVEVSDGPRVSQIVTVASFGEKRTSRQWARMQQGNADLGQGIGPLQLPMASYFPELDVIVQVFPFDFRLPGLLSVVDGSPELVQALAGSESADVWSKDSWQAEVVRYRPDMRVMARVSLLATNARTGQQVSREAFAKVYREEEEGQRSARLLSALSAAAAQGNLDFSVAQPIAYLEQLKTLLLSVAPGVRLLDIVRRSKGDEAIRDVRCAARAVASMHQVDLPADVLPVMAHDKDQQFVDVMAGLVEEHPNLEQQILELQAAIDGALQTPILAPTHYDLKQGHMLLNGEQVYILDFDKMAFGDPLVDVANIVATLSAEREGSRSRVGRGSVLSAGFVEEYFQHAPAAWADLFPAHFARATLLEAATTGRGQRGRAGMADRSEWVNAAIEKAQLALARELW